MVQLITLKLQPVSRTVNHPLLLPTPYQAPPIPAKSPRRTESNMPSVIPLPRTENQWRMVLDEVRATYLRRQYRQCSVRCIQLLEGAQDMDVSLHYIYLSIYAAICLELLARVRPNNCSERLPLFHLARSHFQKADQYMWEAESGHIVTNFDSVGETCLDINHHSPAISSNSSSNSRRSSSSSATDSNNCYSSLSPMHSPASSVCSSFSRSEDESCDLLKPDPLRVKKSVSFYPNPLVDASLIESVYTSNFRRVSRVSPSGPDRCPSPATDYYATSTPPANATASDTVQSSFLISCSLNRCRIHLTVLRTRLKHHLSAITELISSIQSTQYSLLADKPDHKARKSARGNLPASSNSGYKTTLPDIIESEAEEKARRRAVRIAQLKQRGVDWKLGRGRFDGSRYERLCQEALLELQA